MQGDGEGWSVTRQEGLGWHLSSLTLASLHRGRGLAGGISLRLYVGAW